MKRLLAFAFGFFMLLGCKKDAVEAQKTTIEYLTGTDFKKWIITDGVVKDGSLSINLIANQPPCRTDNIFVLYSDKTFELLEGATKCDPTQDPDLIIKGNWDSKQNPESITIDRFFFLGYILEKTEFFISSIGENKFIGTTNVVLNGKSYSAEITFSVVK